ncbi:MAG: efflux RND transporter permease subunit [Wenzhouxiangellaceae bacterium]
MNPYLGIISWFTGNSVAANLLMMVLIFGGLYSALMIKKEIQPKLDPNMITISVPFLGASPSEVEESVLVKIEEAIQDVEGIEKITSTAREGNGTVNVQVYTDYDVQVVLDDVKIRVDGISTFPEQTEAPTINRTQWSQEVMWVSVHGHVSERTLKEFAQQVRDDLVALPGVTRADVVGGRDYEIAIEVSEQTLRQYNLTLDQVAQAVRAGSLDLPAGSIKSDAGDILVRTQGQAYTGEEFERIVVRTNPDGTRLLVSDIARVIDGFEDRERYSMHNGEPAISIRVLSVGEQSELDIAAQVRGYITDKKAELPADIGLDYWADISYYLKGRLDMMNKNLLGGALLVFGVLALFLRLKLAFWVMVGLPVAFLGTLWMMPVAEVSINMLSLFGFILVLGIVVDDAIIIGESIYTHIRRDGHSLQSVIEGVSEVAVPATFGVLTTAVAFIPILMVSGVSGQFFAAIGWVVIFALLFSLVESKLILPAHLAHMKLKPASEQSRIPLFRQLFQLQRRFSEGLHHFVDNRYAPLLERALNRRYVTLSIFVAALILSVGFVTSGLTRWVWFPDLAGDFIQANLEMNEGTPASVTHRAMDRIQEALREVDAEISAENGLTEGGAVRTIFSWSGSDTSGQVVVELVKEENAVITAPEVERRWRDKVGEIPGARQLSFSAATGPGGGADLAFQLVGKNLEQLKMAAAELEQRIRGYDHVYDVQNSFQGGTPEIKLNIKPEAEVLGLNLSALGNQVRQAFYGAEAQRVQRGEDEVKVMVRYPADERRSVGNLENMRIRTPDGDEIPFSAVAEVELGSTPAVIRRFDGERSVSVTAEVDKDLAEPGKIISDILKEALPDILSRYPAVRYRLDGATESQQRVAQELGAGALLAMFLIYALMAIPLRSYLQPFLIMSVIPFGVVGAIFGHLLLGIPVSMLSMFGIIALAGVVVNDSLILVDFVNRARRQGVPRREAAINSAKRRFRAILLTSATTFLGLVPIVFFETSLQALIVKPMAAALAFGIVFSTVITLFLIPSMYLIGDDVARMFSRMKNRMLGRDTPAEAH